LPNEPGHGAIPRLPANADPPVAGPLEIGLAASAALLVLGWLARRRFRAGAAAVDAEDELV
jgi:hypothetical protein